MARFGALRCLAPRRPGTGRRDSEAVSGERGRGVEQRSRPPGRAVTRPGAAISAPGRDAEHRGRCGRRSGSRPRCPRERIQIRVEGRVADEGDAGPVVIGARLVSAGRSPSERSRRGHAGTRRSRVQTAAPWRNRRERMRAVRAPRRYARRISVMPSRTLRSTCTLRGSAATCSLNAAIGGCSSTTRPPPSVLSATIKPRSLSRGRTSS